jgi:hypothetical protein
VLLQQVYSILPPSLLGLFSIYVGPFARNVVPSGCLILSECGSETGDVIGSGDLCSRAATANVSSWVPSFLSSGRTKQVLRR